VGQRAVTGQHIEEDNLKRSLSLPLVTLFGVGTIIGAGIYVLIGEVSAKAGMAAPISFFVAAFLAAFTAFSFAELSSRFPKSAGEAVYVREGLAARGLPILVGLMVILVGMVSAATISNGFVGYLRTFVDLPDFLAVTILLTVLAGLAIWGITESVLLLSAITLIELFGIGMILFAGADALGTFPDRMDEMVPALSWTSASGIFAGAFLAFYAYVGFEDMVNIAEETKDPSRTLPRAIIITLVVTTALYMAVALVAVLSLPIEELSKSDAPLALIYEQSTGRSSALISSISIFAVVNGALVQIIMASRILYGLRDESFLFKPFGQVNAKTQTPILATISVTVVAWVLAVQFSLAGLAETTSAITLAIFTLVNLALVRIKLRGPAPEGTFLVPIWIPITGTLVSGGFLALFIFTNF